MLKILKKIGLKSENKAFTLSEVLLVIGIIGVIAVLVLPSLSKNTGEKAAIASLKKTHTLLAQAFIQAEAKYGPIESWISATDYTWQQKKNRIGARLFDVMKVSKSCNAADGDCFTSGQVNFLYGGTGVLDLNASYPNAILADGVSVSMYNFGGNCADSSEAIDSTDLSNPFVNYCGMLFVDIDGPDKGEFTQGKDVFIFAITKTGIFPYANLQTIDGNNISNNCFKNGSYCAAWVIENDSMDYLKASNGTCSNGTVLSWTVTSCK